MAHLHFRQTTYKSGGASASQRLEYITRAPARDLSTAARQMRYIAEGREDLVYARSRNLPAWAHDNPHVYFSAAERHEGTGRVAFVEMKISLPQELSHRANMALTRDLVEAIAGDQLPVTYAFHDPRTMDGAQQQPHLHLLISTRKTDEYARTAAQHFKRFNRAHPERGGAEKDPAFWHIGAVKAHRVLIADILNTHLERHGHAVRVHPDTLESRQIDRQPEPKLLPSESRQYRAQGIVSETMQQVLDIRAERARHMTAEQENGRTYWEGRKITLGITRDMPMEQRLARVVQARARLVHEPAERRRPPVLTLAREGARLEQSIASLEQYVTALRGERVTEQTYERSGRRRPVPEQWWAERLLAQGPQHGLPRDRDAEQVSQIAATFERLARRGQEQDVGAPGLRVRLHERDQGQDLGMGF